MPSRVSYPLAAALSASLAIAGCDCSGGLSSDDACARPGAPSACGAVCGPTRPCAAGAYCSASTGRCVADCLAGESCRGTGAMCGADGRCPTMTGMDGGVPGRDAPFDGPRPDTTCASVMVGATRVTPNVIFVIDRSGSMTERFEGSRTRWEVLEDSLLARPDGIVFALQSSVRFGFAMYSEQGAIAGCPDLITVPCALDNYTTIDTEYRMHDPGGGTPTGDSIQAILGMLGALVSERDDPTILILATDGEPDTCEDGDDEVGGRRESLDAVRAAFALTPPIRTYAISVGTGVGMTHLQDVANAGLGRMPGEPDAPFWVATDTAGLRAALETIVGGALSCTVELRGSIDVAAACSGEVRLGGDLLACGTDWRAVDSTHIELLGAACDRLQSSTDPLTATFPCGVVIF